MQMVAHSQHATCAQRVAQAGTPRSNKTADRVNGLRRVVDLLRAHGELQREDIAAHFGFALRTARAYIEELERAGVVEIARRLEGKRGLMGQPLYRVIATDERAEQFFKQALQRPRVHEQRLSRTRPIAAYIGSRLLHIMGDDAPFVPKYQRGPVLPDPFALPAAFFSGRALEARA